MSVGYQAVLWNRQKRIYDVWLLGGVLAYMAAFVAFGLALRPGITAETLIIRAAGTASLVLLHVILSIGPLTRWDRRFMPLLYNRRHMGVTMFFLALVHGVFAIFQFHTLGDTHPLVSVLTSNPRIDDISQFPFQPLGLVALIILFLMASTSHDFWLHNLSAPVWKALHMLVYVAYALVVLHVALGALQSEMHPAWPTTFGVGVLWIVGLHVATAYREQRAVPRPAVLDNRVCVGSAHDIVDGCARVVDVAGERVAVFRYGDRVSAVSNVCQHQNGPLGEGRIIDGCITCPWHGYQYDPATGASPPPFTETIPTFSVFVEEGQVWVDPTPHPPGTPIEPARIPS